MPTINASFELVTPAFVAGYDQGTPELRVPSILGQLRMWWRAAYASKYQSKLKRREFDLFGASASDNTPGRGQGRFICRLSSCPGKPLPKAAKIQNLTGDLERLLSRNATRRKRWISPAPFSISLVFRTDRCEPDDLNEVSSAIELWGTLGGIGWLARRGMGSVNVREIAIDGKAQPLPAENAEYTRLLKALRGNATHDRLHDFPTLSAHARFAVMNAGAGVSGLDALKAVAREVVDAANGDVSPDAYLSDQAARAGFGRRPFRNPSPAHIHVHTLQNETLAVLSYLPTTDCYDQSRQPTKSPAAQRIATFISSPAFEEIT